MLIGGGHSHIQVLKAFGQIKSDEFQVTLISDVALASYSGMLPGFMAGVYEKSELHFDLKKICDRYGFEFIESKVIKISQKLNQVWLANNQILSFDVASIDIGIEPQKINTQHQQIIELKPISKLIDKWEKILNTEVTKISIIGGGAAAFEVAIACQQKMQCQVQILTSPNGLLKSMNSKTQRLANQRLKKLRIQVRSESVISEIPLIKENEVYLVATSARAPDLFKNSDLPTTQDGFVKVEDTLLVEGCENIYATGDCCQIKGYKLPKAGVFAVRQGPVLIHNLLSTKQRSYKPQQIFLSLLVSGNKRAILSYGSLSFEGRLFWYLKNWIDRSFIRKFS